MNTFKNPVLPGFSPDPSVCAVGSDYYLVTSTFAYFPCVPIYHSRDLANWIQIGNVLDRESQVKLEGITHSQGIFAPTIRYHDGMFYMITTNVSFGGNFIVTTTDPTSSWSEPYFLDNAPGIDPSLFFDEDGKCYYTGTRPNPRGERHNGDWEVWLQELDPKTMELIGISKKIWKGAMRGAIWPEGPHLYKKDGYYYLMIAEGGTGDDHAITIARSKTVDGAYSGNPKNPIITHRHLGADFPVQNVGHGDLVETPCGKWYLTCLASRIYKGHSNLGRETFLAEVTWEKGWPVINAGHGKLLTKQTHQLSLYPQETKSKYTFKTNLDMAFLSLRTPQPEFYQIKNGTLMLKTLTTKIHELATPSYLGIRQTSMYYEAITKMKFTPKDGEEAGIALIQKNDHNIRLTYGKVGNKTLLQVIKCEGDLDEVLNMTDFSADTSADTVYLKLHGEEQNLSFHYCVNGSEYGKLIDIDARFLSTEVAGGFVGCTIGMYASSNGAASDNNAEFEYFELINKKGDD